jgi:Protein of unknown function (DUF3592)
LRRLKSIGLSLWILLLLSLIPLGLITSVIDGIHFDRVRQSAVGKVLDEHSECTYGFPFGAACNSTIYVEYATTDGQAVRASMSGSGRKGESITIYYDPADPLRPRTTTGSTAINGIIATIVLLAFLFSAGAIITGLTSPDARRRSQSTGAAG